MIIPMMIEPWDDDGAVDPIPRAWAWLRRQGLGADAATAAWEPVVQRVRRWRSDRTAAVRWATRGIATGGVVGPIAWFIVHNL